MIRQTEMGNMNKRQRSESCAVTSCDANVLFDRSSKFPGSIDGAAKASG